MPNPMHLDLLGTKEPLAGDCDLLALLKRMLPR
jgi:hypothetical protein